MQRSTSFITMNWFLDSAIWPDQKSYFWYMKSGLAVASIYAVILTINVSINSKLLSLLTNRRQWLTIIGISLFWGVVVGLLLQLNLATSRWQFILLLASPLIILLFQHKIFKYVASS
jgi:hypothetical protein